MWRSWDLPAMLIGRMAVNVSPGFSETSSPIDRGIPIFIVIWKAVLGGNPPNKQSVLINPGLTLQSSLCWVKVMCVFEFVEWEICQTQGMFIAMLFYVIFIYFHVPLFDYWIRFPKRLWLCSTAKKSSLCFVLDIYVSMYQGLVNVPIQHHPTIGDIISKRCGCFGDVKPIPNSRGHQSQPHDISWYGVS